MAGGDVRQRENASWNSLGKVYLSRERERKTENVAGAAGCVRNSRAHLQSQRHTRDFTRVRVCMRARARVFLAFFSRVSFATINNAAIMSTRCAMNARADSTYYRICGLVFAQFPIRTNLI